VTHFYSVTRTQDVRDDGAEMQRKAAQASGQQPRVLDC
jgi:hypothetical protein